MSAFGSLGKPKQAVGTPSALPLQEATEQPFAWPGLSDHDEAQVQLLVARIKKLRASLDTEISNFAPRGNDLLQSSYS